MRVEHIKRIECPVADCDVVANGKVEIFTLLSNADVDELVINERNRIKQKLVKLHVEANHGR